MRFKFWEKKEKRDCSISTYSPFGDALTFSNLYNKYSAMNISAVYRATEMISDSIAMLPVKIVDENKNELNAHPLSLIFKDKNNSNISKYTLIKLLIQSVILRGNGFALIERAADKTVIGLRFLESSDVNIFYDKQRNELYYTCNLLAKKIYANDIIHLRKNSYDGINGISVLSYASRSLNISNNTENSASQFFNNGCNLSGVLTVQGQLSDKQREQIKSSWNQAYSSGGNGLAVLQGNMSYQPIQLTSRDSQMLESRMFNVSDIARFFGISPMLLGDLSHSSYSTLEAVQQSFILHTLQPYIVMVESEFNKKLLKESESNLEINLDETYLLKSDKTATANYYNSLLNSGVLSINEVRTELGYDSIGEAGDKHLIAYTDINQNTIENNNNETKIEEDEKN